MSPRPAPRKPVRPARAGGRPGGPGARGPQRSGSERRSSSGRDFDGIGGDQVEGRQAVLELLKAKRRNVQKIFIADNQDS